MILEITKSFPPKERFSMIDQIRRSSHSDCTNIAEAWRKRKYPAHFVSKLTDSAGESDETRVWLEITLKCRYISDAVFDDLDERYDLTGGQLVKMMSDPNSWTIR